MGREPRHISMPDFYGGWIISPFNNTRRKYFIVESLPSPEQWAGIFHRLQVSNCLVGQNFIILFPYPRTVGAWYINSWKTLSAVIGFFPLLINMFWILLTPLLPGCRYSAPRLKPFSRRSHSSWDLIPIVWHFWQRERSTASYDIRVPAQEIICNFFFILTDHFRQRFVFKFRPCSSRRLV